jgi:hypothetical protein
MIVKCVQTWTSFVVFLGQAAIVFAARDYASLRSSLFASVRATPLVSASCLQGRCAEQSSRCHERKVHTEFYLKPTENDVHEMKKTLSSDKTYLRFTEEQKATLFARMLEIKRVMELYDDIEESTERTKRTRYARKLQSALDRLIVILDEQEGNAHLIQVMAETRDTLGLNSHEIVDMVTGFEQTAARLLQASKRVYPRKADSPPPARPPKALAEVRMMKDLLERLGVTVGVTGGETGGPATRLMAGIHRYVSGGDLITADAIKDRLKRLKDWEDCHPA